MFIPGEPTWVFNNYAICIFIIYTINISDYQVSFICKFSQKSKFVKLRTYCHSIVKEPEPSDITFACVFPRHLILIKNDISMSKAVEWSEMGCGYL